LHEHISLLFLLYSGHGLSFSFFHPLGIFSLILSMVFFLSFFSFFHSPCLFFQEYFWREREVTLYIELYFYGMNGRYKANF
jgi:hypothetical protein